MFQTARLLRNRFTRIMNLTTTTPLPQTLLSESDLRSLTHEQLLTYVLRHAAAPSTESQSNISEDDKSKINKPSSSGLLRNPDQNNTHAHHNIETEENQCDDGSEGRGIKRRNKDDKNATKRNKAKKPRKQFDMSRYGQRMIALKLNYQGWKFHGFAAQVTTEDTVEAHLFSALLRTRLIESRETCDYSRAGRTDVGVSALGQVVGLRVRSAIVPPSTGTQEVDYVKTINSALPDGMRVVAWSPVCDGTADIPRLYDQDSTVLKQYWDSASRKMKNISDNSNQLVNRHNSHEKNDVEEKAPRRPGEKFSARFDATSRSYKYFFARSTLDLKAMSEAAKYFEGRHDFRNFCRFDENVSNFERLLFNVEIRRVCENGDEECKVCENERVNDVYAMYYIFVHGQAFLWHQVRCMAAVLFDVGRGLEEPKVVFDMLNDVKMGTGAFAHGRPHYRLASATPLLLFNCNYPKDVVWFEGYSDCNNNDEGEKGKMEQSLVSLERADDHIAECWTSVASKCAVVKEILKDNDRMFGLREGNNKGMSERKNKRLLMVDAGPVDKGRHIKYRNRGRDDPVPIKIQRAKMKRSDQEGGDDVNK